MVEMHKSYTSRKRVKVYLTRRESDGVYTGGWPTEREAIANDTPTAIMGRCLCGIFSTAKYFWSKRHATRLPNKREQAIMDEAERIKKEFKGCRGY